MLEQLTVARNGSPTVLAGGKALHSRYDPAGEAERYIDTLENLGDARFFIFIEPCLGYALPVVQKRYPEARLISLHASDFFTACPGAETAGVSWAPGTGTRLQEFLEAAIPDTAARTVRIIEWRPALAVYGGAYLDLLKETTDFIKRVDANSRTIRGFGRRWFRNCLRNVGIIRKALCPPRAANCAASCAANCAASCAASCAAPYPWVVTGAGPSLEEAIPLIRRLRDQRGGRILAAASSAPALAAARLKPDMIISTDGGNWALLHLYESARERGAMPALAACLWSAIPSRYGDAPVLLLVDGSLWQRIILEAVFAGQPAFGVFPSRGTVTAQAVDLALALTSGPVFLTGMDLAHRDIKSHAKPYAFDRLQDETADRFAPRYSQTFVRSAHIAASGSNGIYAAWFKRQLADYPERLFSLGTNNPVFDALGSPASLDALDMTVPGGELFPPETTVYSAQAAGAEASRRAARALINALEHPRTAGILCGELGPLILAEGEPASPVALKAAIETLERGASGG